jgi:hypothetical protein
MEIDDYGAYGDLAAKWAAEHPDWYARHAKRVLNGSAGSTQSWNPSEKTAEILDRAWHFVQSVPYKASARWVFYRLLQEGYYGSKSDYGNKWLKASSTARKSFYKSWRPDVLADETRARIERGQGDTSADDWVQSISEQGLICSLDKWRGQDYYIELWYEARAMTEQFKYYTENITLVPMGGQPSIPHKWNCAKALASAMSKYHRPIKILYFGDLDTHGDIISDVVEREVRQWSGASFEFIRCGLNIEQVQRFDVPENPDKPGEYQWEALSDEGAEEIISSNVDKFLRHDAIEDITEQEREAEYFVQQAMEGLIDKWKERDE